MIYLVADSGRRDRDELTAEFGIQLPADRSLEGQYRALTADLDDCQLGRE